MAGVLFYAADVGIVCIPEAPYNLTFSDIDVYYNNLSDRRQKGTLRFV